MTDSMIKTKNANGLDLAKDDQAIAGSNNQPDNRRGSEPAKNTAHSNFNSNLHNEHFRTQKYRQRNIAALRGAKVKRADLIMFTTQLSVMLDSGVVLSDALAAISEQAGQNAPVLSRIISVITEEVKNGEKFSTALEAYPKTFNSMFVSMVKASEASGKMAEMLSILADYLDFEAETRKSVKAALTYPLIMAIMAVAATGTLMFFVMPRFMKIYESKGASLPKLTQVLVAFSSILGDPEKLTMCVTVIIAAAMAFYYWAGTKNGKQTLDYVKIHTPVLGTMFIDMIVARSMRIMSTMLNTGVSLLDAIQVIQGSCDNYYLKRLWIQTDKKIQDGYQLSESIQISQGSELIAPAIIQMIRAGEKSGKLAKVSDKISVFYEKKLEGSIKTAMTLIEPIMITVLGSIIGTVAIALLLPIFKISSVIAQ